MTGKSDYTELLGRELFTYQPGNKFENVYIAITGAAGSIGSHLTRTLLKKTEARLILIDQHEHSLNQLLVENQVHKSRVHPLLTDIRDPTILKKCFQEYQPTTIIHTAAYKQVPMLEVWPAAAILNNIQNTEIMYDVAVDSGIEKFIFISTDKAFTGDNVLGRSKKIAEQIIITGNENMQCLLLRFGNVLFSSGSVTELFRNQIRGNKPMTLTNPEATRYFIAPEEGSDLILFALDRELPNAIYYLYQKKQIRIIDLAGEIYRHYCRNEPQGDWWKKIDPRPGDTLTEFDLDHINAESIEVHPMVRKIRFQRKTQPEVFREKLQDLYRLAVTSCSIEEMEERLKKLSTSIH